MNLILNNLAHSLPNVVQGNTMLVPYHMRKKMTFDYIVSNPPFKLDFSDWRDDIDASKENVRSNEGVFAARFFAGVPKVPAKEKDKMSIYLLFIQHIISSLKPNGKAAVVVPTGFLTEGKGKATNIANKIRMRLVDQKMLRAVVSMPSNIFANTGTNVSIIFIDRANKSGKVVLVDATNLGIKIKDGKNQRTLLSPEEEKLIIDTVNGAAYIDGFSAVKTFEEIKSYGGYSFNPGTYFDVKIEYLPITTDEFEAKMQLHTDRLNAMFASAEAFQSLIKEGLGRLRLEQD